MMFYGTYITTVSKWVEEAPGEIPCARCGQVKPTGEFTVMTARGRKRYHSYCMPCQGEYARDFRAKDVQESRRKANAYYAANAERKRAVNRAWRARTGFNRAHQLRHLYGISLEQYQELLDAQDGVCAICKLPPQGQRKFLAVDHDHETGEIRGLLCTTCNVGLGALRDSTELVRSALAYLEGGGARWPLRSSI